MVELHYTTRDGRILRKIVSDVSVLEVEEDPRQGVKSRSIVKLTDGSKLYCTQTYEELMQSLLGNSTQAQRSRDSQVQQPVTGDK